MYKKQRSAGRGKQELCKSGERTFRSWHAAAARFDGRQAGCDGGGRAAENWWESGGFHVGRSKMQNVELHSAALLDRGRGFQAARMDKKSNGGQINRWGESIRTHRACADAAWDWGQDAWLLG